MDIHIKRTKPTIKVAVFPIVAYWNGCWGQRLMKIKPYLVNIFESYQNMIGLKHHICHHINQFRSRLIFIAGSIHPGSQNHEKTNRAIRDLYV